MPRLSVNDLMTTTACFATLVEGAEKWHAIIHTAYAVIPQWPGAT
jgi:hypothetical protein